MKITFIVNPLSKNGRTLEWFESNRSEISKVLTDFDVLLTKKTRHATALCSKALQSGSQIIVSVGGDGTHHEVLNGFFDSQGQHYNKNAALALLNSGTGGDFIRSLTQSRDKTFKQSLERIKKNQQQLISVGHIQYQNHSDQQEQAYFLNVASIGLSGEVDKIVNSSSKRFGSKATFLSATLKAFINYKSPKVNIVIDNNAAYQAKIQLLALCNGQYFGGGMKLSPAASPFNQQMNLVQIQEQSATFWLKNIAKVYSGKHQQLKEIQMHDISTLKVTACDNSQKDILIDVDGEQLGKLPVEMHILANQVNLVL